MNKIDFIIHYDHLHKYLKDIYFYPSFNKYLSESFNLIEFFDDNNETDGTYRSSHWSDMIIKRFDIIQNLVLKNIDSNKIFVFSDIDIIFFQNIYNDIINTLGSDYEIAYMSENVAAEHGMINGGFFAFRCSRNVLSYFQKIQNSTINSAIKNDQPVIQNYLKNNNDISFTIFDRYTFCTNNNPRYISEKLIPIMKVFHGTSACNMIEKCQILSTVSLKRQAINDPTVLLNKNLWIK